MAAKNKKSLCYVTHKFEVAQQFPEASCPRWHLFCGCSLCHSVVYRQVGPIKHLTHSVGAFLLPLVGFGSGPPRSALNPTLTFSNFRGGSDGKLDQVPVNCCKKYTNEIFIKWATSSSYFQIALKGKRFIGDRKQYWSRSNAHNPPDPQDTTQSSDRPFQANKPALLQWSQKAGEKPVLV